MLNPEHTDQYRAIIASIGNAIGKTIADLTADKRIGRGRVTIRKRVNELVETGVLEKAFDAPASYAVADNAPSLDTLLGVAPPEAAPVAEEPQKSLSEPLMEHYTKTADEVLDTVRPVLRDRLAKLLEGYSDAWDGEIADLKRKLAERDAEVADLKTRNEQLTRRLNTIREQAMA